MNYTAKIYQFNYCLGQSRDLVAEVGDGKGDALRQVLANEPLNILDSIYNVTLIAEGLIYVLIISISMI